MASVTTTTPDTTTGVTTTLDPSTATVIPTTTAPPVTTTSTNPPTTSVVTAEPSTTFVAPTTAIVPTTIITSITSIITQAPTNQETQGPIITTITSYQSITTFTPSVAAPSSSSSSSASASNTPISPSGQSRDRSGGLSSGATIAIGVIIPIVAVIAGVLFGLWFWRRRKSKKNAEEMRKNDMAEYGFNPNNDPSLPVGAAVYTDGGSEGNDDSGYRGWGATSSTNRKASTTMGSNSRAANGGQGMSDAGSQPGGYNMQPSPSAGGASEDPLVHGYDGAAAAGMVGGAAAAGGMMAAGARNRNSQVSSGMHRGISNASSAYSRGAPPSDVSSDAPEMPRPYYQEEVPYNIYNDVQQGHGPYSEPAYGGAGEEPVIRDVQARRNTRIERAPTLPQQGGIAQNF